MSITYSGGSGNWAESAAFALAELAGTGDGLGREAGESGPFAGFSGWHGVRLGEGDEPGGFDAMTPNTAVSASSAAPAPRFGLGVAQGSAGNGSRGFSVHLGDSAAKLAPPAGGAAAPSLTAFNGRSESATRAAIHKSAADFETAALGQLLAFMTQSIEVDSTFGGGHGEEMFRDMMNAEYGKMFSKSGRTGIADQVERQLLRSQGLKPVPKAALKV